MDTAQYNWHLLQTWQLPEEGRIIKISINKKDYFLSRFKDELYAGKSTCPHAKGDLTKGHLTKNGEIVCPLHRFKFSLKDGKETTAHGGFCVPTYPVKKATDGQFYIGFLKTKNWFGF